MCRHDQKRSPFPHQRARIRLLARNFQVVFKSIRKECFSEYLGTAIRYYGHQDFEAYVMFWPDAENHFVWSSKNLSVQMEALEVVR